MKKEMLCPFARKPCLKEECVLYRRGLRYFADKKEPQPFEECAINVGVDCLENLVGRSIGNQKATEETRNQMTKLNELLYGMAEKKYLEKV
jgi:hypothetical protein